MYYTIFGPAFEGHLCSHDSFNYNSGMTHSKTKGFTLIETLLVVFLIAMLATVALSSYTNSTGTFNFLSAVQDVMSTLQTARADAINNRQQSVGGIAKTPARYGVCIGSDVALTFADLGNKSSKFDPSSKDISSAGIAKCLIDGDTSPADGADGVTFDPILADKNFKISSQYKIVAYKSDGISVLDLPIFVYYEAGTGNLSAFNNKNVLIKKSEKDQKFIILEISEGTKLTKYLRISQVSGLPEEVSGL